MGLLMSLLLYIGGIATAIIHNKGRMPESISDMEYEVSPNKRIIWVVWTGLIVLGFYPYLLDALIVELQFIGFITAACILFCISLPFITGTNKEALSGDEDAFHNWLGVIGGLLTQFCVGLINPLWLLWWSLLPLLAILDTWVFMGNTFWEEQIVAKLENKLIFVLEVLCAVTLYSALIFG